ncbi:MGMT family protein [Chloroflexi bacterium TSY]|nr:MGMT family protein [Chloroflexi bacterium TSY]
MIATQGLVKAVYLKPTSGTPSIVPQVVPIHLSRGYGVEGDVHAHSSSPRQLLITHDEDLCSFGIQTGQLHENIVLSDVQKNLFRPGALLHVGESAQIRLTFHCEPCARIQHLADLNAIRNRRGILGVVLQSGAIQKGDPVRAIPGAFPPLSDVPYQRFLGYLAMVPMGKVVSFRQIALGMGVTTSYCRAIPSYIRRTSSAEYPVHRIVNSNGSLIERHVPNQESLLLEEQIVVESRAIRPGKTETLTVDLSRYEWKPSALYLT